jgi:hypothetical protein
MQCTFLKSKRKARNAQILSLIIVAGVLFSFSYFTCLTGWVVDTAEYKFFVNAKGNLSNLTISNYIYFFNASTGSINAPEGVHVDTQAYMDGNWSRIDITFNNFGKGLAVITLSEMEPLTNVPPSSIPVDVSSLIFLPNQVPGVQGNLVNVTNLFVHLSVSAKTPLGKLNIYTHSAESILINGNLKWNYDFQFKDTTLTVSVMGFIFLSVAISWTCVAFVSFLFKRKTLWPFPIFTICFASVMCLLYVYIGVGDDLLSNANLTIWSRILLSFLSPLFHFYYSHLMDNLLYSFIIGGSIVEIWLYGIYNSKRYVWYFSPLPISILFTFFSFPSGQYYVVSSGASLWCVGLVVVLLLAVYKERVRLFKSVSFWNLVVLLLIGYLLFSSSWNFVANALITPDSANWGALLIHDGFAVIYGGIAVLVSSLAESMHELSVLEQ